MYYPIIDKLKEIMAEIGQGGGHLVIEATASSTTGGPYYNLRLLADNTFDLTAM